MGQSVHFLRYAPIKNEYGIKRYLAETRRLLSVMETHLAATSYLVGDKYSVADIACFPWTSAAWYCGVDIADFPAVKGWRDPVAAREAVKKGMQIPAPFFAGDESTKDPATADMRKKIQVDVTENIRQETESMNAVPAAGFGEF